MQKNKRWQKERTKEAHSPSCHLGVLQVLVVLAGFDDEDPEARVALREPAGYDTPGRATSRSSQR